MSETTISLIIDTAKYIGYVIGGCTSLYGVAALIYNHFWNKTVNLSIGSFKVKKKFHTVQNLTNIVSAHFYDGGTVPPEIRREILLLTCPDINDLEKKDAQNMPTNEADHETTNF